MWNTYYHYIRHFLAMDDIYNDSDLSKYGLINNKDVLNFVTQNIVETNYS